MTFQSKPNNKKSQIYIFFSKKSFGKQTEKQVDALESLHLSNKKDELNQIKSILTQNHMNDLIL